MVGRGIKIKIEMGPGSAFWEEGEGFVQMSIAASDNDIDTGFGNS